MKKIDSGLVDKDIEFLERMTCVTEELEDLVQISKEKKRVRGSVITREDLMSMMGKRKKSFDKVPSALLGVFRLLVIKNLVRGRLFASSYNSGKEIGLSASVRTQKDIEKIAKRLGMGDIEFVKFDPENVIIKLSEGITATGVKQSQRPICFFEAGIFSGLLANAFHKKINMKEVKCRAKGDPCCMFESSVSEFRTNASTPLYPVDIYSQENLKLLTSLASHAITAIENAVMFEKTRQQIVIDALTQVYNNRYFRSRMNAEYKRAERHDIPLTVFMIDVDDFKKFNDRYGHPMGDTILKTVALNFVENLRDIDIVARYGGDEFSIILPQTDSRGARIVADRLRHMTMKKKIKYRKKNIGVSISIGGVTLRKKYMNGKPMAMVDLADKALLSAKHKGKNNIVLVNKT